MNKVNDKNTADKPNLKLIQVDQESVKNHLNEVVLQTVEQTLNQLLDKEADELLDAGRYERREGRKGNRAGHYKRGLHTTAGEVTLKVPKLKGLKFETEIIERYRRREASVEESLIEMYLAGVSVRRVEDITEALWGTRVSPSTVSKLNQKIYGHIEEWRNKPIVGEHPYVYLDGIVLKRCWAGEVRNVSILVAIGVSADGYREILGITEGGKEDKAGWGGFLRHLKERGLKGVELMISDKCLGLVESITECFPEVKWQRCTVHFYRNVFCKVPKSKVREVAAMLKAVHAQESLSEARNKAYAVKEKLRAMKLPEAAKVFEEGIEETLTYHHFPETHHKRIRTNNPMERLLKEIRRRTKVIGAFPDSKSALMLSAARLRHVAGREWGSKRYLEMTELFTPKEVTSGA